MAENNRHSSFASKTSSTKAEQQRRRERRLQVAAIVLIVSGLLATLSIVSYSQSDEAPLDRSSFTDIIRFPFDAAVKARASGMHNRLGLIGALVANFFINSTVGYSSIVFPMLMLLWGWVILRKKDTGKPITVTVGQDTTGIDFSLPAGGFISRS